MHAVYGWFDSPADVKKAVNSLKKEGFTEGAISVRDFDRVKQKNGEKRPETPARTMVAVQAEGKSAARAWSVLQDVRTRLSKRD